MMSAGYTRETDGGGQKKADKHMTEDEKRRRQSDMSGKWVVFIVGLVKGVNFIIM